MNLTELKFLLNKYHLSPNKIRGQNFLISNDVLQEIIVGSQVTNQDLVLEVGPGLGALTQELIKKAKQVIAFEIDQQLIKPLNKLEKANRNLEIIWQDILSLTDDHWQDILQAKQAKEYKIIANLPYYLTAKFIKKFILAVNKPISMTIMVQKEVAERIVSDNQKHSLLSLSVAFYAQSKIVTIVPKSNFYPEPKVDSAILYIYKIHNWNYQEAEKKVWQLIHRGFAYKRKKLINNLASDQNLDKDKLRLTFDKLKLDLNIRAEDLTVNDWLQLGKYL